MSTIIKKFVRASLTYAGSAFMFSIGRQILFLPILNYLNPELFKPISITIVLVDFCSYFLGSSIADYYVRNTKPEYSTEDNLLLFFKLRKLTIISLVSFFIFLYYSFNILEASILSLYLWLFSINTINLKLFFNKLLFKINYYYMVIRLFPYFMYLILVSLYKEPDVTLFFLLLLIGELYFMLYLNMVQNKEFELTNYQYLKKDKISISEFKSLAIFIFVYVSFSLLQRFDLLVIEKIYPEQYAEYYQMLSIFLIGVNPIILLTSASLLSILTHVTYNSFEENRLKLLSTIICIGFLAGTVFYYFSPYIVSLLYPKNIFILEYQYLAFVIISNTICFLILKTFLIKFSQINIIFFMNVIIIIISYITSLYSLLYFVIMFYLLRAILYILVVLGIPVINKKLGC